jgi:16S rRNA (guanine527-N7)-methyltransferase
VIDPLLAVLDRSRALGFLGPGPLDGHLDHALAFTRCVSEPPARALDLGAGGGLPGMVLARRVWPATRWTFLDAQRKRTDFLQAAVDELQLTERVTVVTDRAEVVGRSPEHRACYDLVVARSFGPPAVTAECAAPLLRPGGRLVVSEPPTGSAGRWPDDGLDQVGLAAVGPLEAAGVHLMVLVRTTAPIDRLPRRPGIPTKRPLFSS